jgi:hypothetical protein
MILFVGDYEDSYDISDAKIIHNLKEIIQFKKDNPDKVVLLIGNHDNQYIYSYQSNGCSGFRYSYYQELHQLYNDNIKLFKPIHQVDNYLFSHAGITSVWFNKMKKEVEDTPYSFENFKNIEEWVTALWNKNHISLYDVGRTRGGWLKSGGPFWCDKSELIAYMLPNYTQIIGHTPVKEITIHENKQQNAKAIFCDTTYDYYELEI